jgi:hypothetical protein
LSLAKVDCPQCKQPRLGTARVKTAKYRQLIQLERFHGGNALRCKTGNRTANTHGEIGTAGQQLKVWRSTWGRVQAREHRISVRCSFCFLMPYSGLGADPRSPNNFVKQRNAESILSLYDSHSEQISAHPKYALRTLTEVPLPVPIWNCSHFVKAMWLTRRVIPCRRNLLPANFGEVTRVCPARENKPANDMRSITFVTFWLGPWSATISTGGRTKPQIFRGL